MEQYLSILRKTKLFTGLKDEEILSVLKCLNSRLKTFNKNSVIFCEGDTAECIGVILSGEIETQKMDYDGNVNIISKLKETEIIAATVCYSTNKQLPFDIVATSPCTILCLNKDSLVKPCCLVCSFHTTIIKNMLNAIADKNIALTRKIDILTKRTIREKVLAYLFAHSKNIKSKRFSVNLSRQQMAEFFSVSRSALSKELCKMQGDGLIIFNKNNFTLLEKNS